MASNLSSGPRKLLPRWRDSQSTLDVGELRQSRIGESLARHQSSDVAELANDFKRNRSKSFAVDLVTAAFATDHFDLASSAAEYILSLDDVSTAVRKIAKKVLRIDDKADSDMLSFSNKKDVYAEIAKTRAMTRTYPRNALAWLELGRQYNLISEIEKAKSSIDVALKLFPDSRYILRSAARFFAHIDDHERAHLILRNSDRIRFDPWIMAAEVGIASARGIPPVHFKSGMRVLASASFSSFDLSELSGALGTVELLDGSPRRARDLFRKALESPTENSLAQAKWASDQKGIRVSLEIDVATFNVTRAYEALYLESFSRQAWRSSLAHSIDWLRDEPFSHRPASSGSYIASLLEDYDLAVKIAKLGLIANPNNANLLNNLAFSLAYQGNVEDAEQPLALARGKAIDVADIVSITATEGLLAFRLGNVLAGRERYGTAIKMAEERKLPRLVTLAKTYWALEEIRISSNTFIETVLDDAVNRLTTGDYPEFGLLLKRLHSRLRVIRDE